MLGVLIWSMVDNNKLHSCRREEGETEKKTTHYTTPPQQEGYNKNKKSIE